MFLKLLGLFLYVTFAASDGSHDFIYNGFKNPNISLVLDGSAEIMSNGILRLSSSVVQQGHAVFPIPIHFKNSPNGSTLSFSTAFVFAIVPQFSNLSTDGMAFSISPLNYFPGARPNQFLGLFNESNNNNSLNHIVAIEFDTFMNADLGDINNNHVGIDINGITSNKSAPAAYYTGDQNSGSTNILLSGGQPIQVWVEYNGVEKQLNVTLSPAHLRKPNRPLLSLKIDISPLILETMYVGFSSSTGPVPTSHYVLGWSFKMNGQAQELMISQLPRLPRTEPKKESKVFTIGLPLVAVVLGLMMVTIIILVVRRKIKFAEVLEDWELQYGPHRFKYKDLFIATKGFKEDEVLGIGGFGRVYKGVMPKSKIEVAVKRLSHESRQGMQEFIAEIVSIGQLRHRNLVQLLGYCRRKRELLLVYDFMPNGSLEKFLFGRSKSMLEWRQRFRIIKGVASGLLYLHEEWEQVVIHRDIKASNVLLDHELNARLGDFGLAKLHDHGTNTQTTRVVGSVGYMAPELTRTSKATTKTDVFAFGAFMLEVACGRRPIEVSAFGPEELILVDWVLECWRRGRILEASDPKLGTHYVVDEMVVVLNLALLCSHPISEARPGMRQVMQILDGDAPLPELSADGLHSTAVKFRDNEGFDEFILSSSITGSSVLSGGR